MFTVTTDRFARLLSLDVEQRAQHVEALSNLLDAAAALNHSGVNAGDDDAHGMACRAIAAVEPFALEWFYSCSENILGGWDDPAARAMFTLLDDSCDWQFVSGPYSHGLVDGSPDAIVNGAELRFEPEEDGTTTVQISIGTAYVTATYNPEDGRADSLSLVNALADHLDGIAVIMLASTL
jgi:hypothetical protein